MAQKSSRIAPGDRVDVRHLDSVSSGPVMVPDPQGLTHLQFRRYAGCPICNVHLRSFGQRHGELVAAGVREIAVFHSTTAAMAPYQDTLPFVLIADPQRILYRQFGVDRSLRSIADPRAWSAVARGWNRRLPPQSDTGDGGHTGLPADFLIAPGGRILACKYGSHANDHWSFDEVLDLARYHGVQLDRDV